MSTDDFRPIIDYPAEHFQIPTYQITITTGIDHDGEEGIYITEAGQPPAIWSRIGVLETAKDMLLNGDEDDE